MTSLSIHPHSLRNRLQLGAFGVPMLIVTLVAGMWISGSALFPYLFGDDLVPSYMAGTFVREGHADKLMDFNAAKRFQADLRRHHGLEQHGRTGPWLNPPFFALLFVPLSALPYRAALWTWFGLNVAMLAASIFLLYRMLPPDRRRKSDAAIIAGLLIASMPALQAMACQQNTFLSLLILCGTVTLWRADRLLLAGVVGGLLAFKPQLAVLVWAVMALLAGRRAVAGIAMTVASLGLITLTLMPGTAGDYFQHLGGALPYANATRPYAWPRQVTIQGFVRVLLQSDNAPNTPLTKAVWLALVGVIAAPLGWRLNQSRKSTPLSPHARDRAIALTITAMPLLMPYYMDYDLLLLAVPATLLAAERMSGAATRPLLTGAFAIFYAALYFNTAIADVTQISFAVVLLAMVAALQIVAMKPKHTLENSEPTEAGKAHPMRAAA